MILKAVITGDLISSSIFKPEQRKTIQIHLKDVLEKIYAIDETKFFIFRGDSIQGIINNPKYALRDAIFIKAGLKSLQFDHGKRASNVDIRLSIGLGEISFYGGSIQESDGPAFHFSGRELENLKKSNRSLSLTSADDGENKKWQVILGLMEDVMTKWTISSAEIVYNLLLVNNEAAISEILKISQPAVNLRKKHAGWEAIKATIEYYEHSF